jgi:hypothetical protein
MKIWIKGWDEVLSRSKKARVDEELRRVRYEGGIWSLVSGDVLESQVSFHGQGGAAQSEAANQSAHATALATGRAPLIARNPPPIIRGKLHRAGT